MDSHDSSLSITCVPQVAPLQLLNSQKSFVTCQLVWDFRLYQPSSPVHSMEIIGHQVGLFAHKLLLESHPELVFITTISSTEAIFFVQLNMILFLGLI